MSQGERSTKGTKFLSTKGTKDTKTEIPLGAPLSTPAPENFVPFVHFVDKNLRALRGCYRRFSGFKPCNSGTTNLPSLRTSLLSKYISPPPTSLSCLITISQ